MVEGCFFDKEKGRIADNMHYHFQRQNGMDIDWTTQLYNQATFIGSAVMLYKATGEKAYLDDAVLAADYVRNEMCDADGLLPFKMEWNREFMLPFCTVHHSPDRRWQSAPIYGLASSQHRRGVEQPGCKP